jgi:hypothetical protein
VELHRISQLAICPWPRRRAGCIASALPALRTSRHRVGQSGGGGVAIQAHRFRRNELHIGGGGQRHGRGRRKGQVCVEVRSWQSVVEGLLLLGGQPSRAGEDGQPSRLVYDGQHSFEQAIVGDEVAHAQASTEAGTERPSLREERLPRQSWIVVGVH